MREKERKRSKKENRLIFGGNKRGSGWVSLSHALNGF